MNDKFNVNKLSFINTFAINNYFLTGLELYKRKIEQARKSRWIHTIRNARRNYMSSMIEKEVYKNADRKIRNKFFLNVKEFPRESFHQFLSLTIIIFSSNEVGEKKIISYSKFLAKYFLA